MDIPSLLGRVGPERSPWNVVQAFDGGSQGAYLVRDSQGVHAVVKVHVDASLSYFTAMQHRIGLLRARGVPIAAHSLYDLNPGVLIVQAFLPGQAGSPLSLPMVEELLDFNSRQAGLADEPPQAWRALMRESLTDGLAGYCEHASLRDFNSDSAHLLARIRSVGLDSALDQLPADDLVHYDMHPANVLSVDGRTVSGIVDWDAVRTGDRHFDITMLTFTSMWRPEQDVIERLWSEFLTRGDDTRRAVMLHHTVLRLVDWMIRHADAGVAGRTIAAGQRALNSLDAGRLVGPKPEQQP